METWRRVERYPEYEISDLGRLRRGDYIKVPLRHPRGYLRYGIGKHHKVLAHRLVCEAFHGSPPTPAHEVAHNNGRRDDNRAENLRWATPAENQADRKAHGTYHVGEQCSSTKLSKRQVGEIRESYRQGGRRYSGGAVTMGALAERYGVSVAQISRVVNEQHWRPDGHLRHD